MWGSSGGVCFLRRNMRVQSMLAKDSVSKRINSENSMSFAEFAYQCLQSNDFLHLHQRFGCICQVGGSDQWGNITSGIDFVKRVTSHVPLFECFPLVCAWHHRAAADQQPGPQVRQIGGQRRLDRQDADVERTADRPLLRSTTSTSSSCAPTTRICRRCFAYSPTSRRSASTSCWRSTRSVRRRGRRRRCSQVAQRRRVDAEEVMIATRSQEDLRRAKLCAELLFGERDDLTVEMLRDVMDELPLTTLSAQEMLGKPVTDFLVAMQFADSKSESMALCLLVEAAKRLIAGGGVRLNGKVVQQPSHVVNKSDLLDGCILPLRVGKRTRKFAILH